MSILYTNHANNYKESINKIPCYLDGKYYPGTEFHTHSKPEIMYVASGMVYNQLESHTQPINEYQLTFVRAEDYHGCYAESVENLEMYTIEIPVYLFKKITYFYGRDSKQLLDQAYPISITLDLFEHNQLLKLFRKACTNSFDDEHGQTILNILSNALYYLYNKPKEEIGTTPEWFSKLLIDLNKYENFFEGISKINKLVSYSKEHVNRCFKKYLSITPSEYINNIRLNYAANRLRLSDATILQVLLESGFENESYFHRCFKKRFNCTPNEYRKDIGKFSKY